MSGDRLAQIEEAVRDAMDAGGDFRYEPVGLAGEAALVALVEIAKAARLIQALDQAGGNDWWEAHAKLYAALARLDSGTAEEDA